MLDFLMEYGYAGLFAASFLAATILPFSSDVVFIGLLYAGLEPIPCLLLATSGNWLGGMTNYFLGKLGKLEWIEKYLRIKKEKIYEMQEKMQGKAVGIMAFLSFLPFIGDVMAVALGFMRTNIRTVAFFMLLGKFSRYVLEMILLKMGVNLLAL